MSESRLNIELFKKIRDRIATKPESYDQSDWIAESNVAPCGSVACLAGHAIICSALTVQLGIEQLHSLLANGDTWAVPNRAKKLLGLNGDFKEWCSSIESDPKGNETAIFDASPMAWPDEFRDLFYEGDEAEAAVAFLDHIIETGKVLD